MNEAIPSSNSKTQAASLVPSAHTTQQHRHVFQRLISLDVEQSVLTVCFAANKQHEELQSAKRKRQKKPRQGGEGGLGEQDSQSGEGVMNVAPTVVFEK